MKTAEKKITNKFNLPDAFVQALDLTKHNEKGHLSATTLNKGTKEIVLEDRHWSDITVEVADSVWQIWGNAVHAIFEKVKSAGGFREEYFEHKVGHHTITGRVDYYDMANEVLYDWKTCSVWKIKMGSFDDWRKQGEVYAWLLKKAGLPIKKVRFVALIKDHSKTDARKDAEYPKFPAYVYEFDIDDELINRVDERIKSKEADVYLAEQSKDDDIKPCTMEERWGSPPKFAVMKTGRKTALKLYDDKVEAEKRVKAEGKGAYLEERKAANRKCEGYCGACAFCNFWRENVATEEQLKALEMNKED